MNRNIKLYSILFFGLMAGLIFTGCTSDSDRESLGNYFARLYYLSPDVVSDSTNTDLIFEAGDRHVNPDKKKLVLVHGWHVEDIDIVEYLSIPFLKDRILASNWSDFIETGQYQEILDFGFDVFAFDYLSSDYIDRNGERLREKLDDLFGGESETVVIYANSMGSIVSRFAVYEENRPAYLKKVITTGAPFMGSPWASPEFDTVLNGFSDLAAFLTSTEGGLDMRWQNADGSIPGASNPKLDSLNSLTDRDDLFYSFYGSYNENGDSPSPGAGLSLISDYLVNVCSQMGAAFAPSDCIVPESSATIEDRIESKDLGNYDHIDMKMGTGYIRDEFVNYLFGLY